MTLRTLPPSERAGAVGFRAAGTAPPDAPPLVLLHGVGMQSAAWAPQMQAFAATHRVIALDLPGHGLSAALAPGAELGDFVDWTAAALEALGLTTVSLAGHSMGALIAAGVAVRHPHRMARVALLNGVYRRDPEARRAVEARAARIGGGDFDTDTPLLRWFGSDGAHAEARAQVAGWLGAVEITGYAAAYGAFARGDAVFADALGTIACPFLALTGDLDRNSTPAMARAMAAAVPHGQAVVIEGHGHMVNLTASQPVNAALAQWLGTTSAGATP